MCFSASASFGAGAILVGAGVYAIKTIESPRMLAFASVPIIFGVQQLSEGLLWLSFSNPDFVSWRNISIYSFIFFAQVIWPVWVPFAVGLMEPDKTRKKMISYFMWIGGAFSIYIIYCLFTYEVSAIIEARHIRYLIDFPNLGLRRSIYILITLVPIFLSSLRWMKVLGGAFLGSLVLTYMLYNKFHFLFSVWCFFAAILSVLVLFVIAYNKESFSRTARF